MPYTKACKRVRNAVCVGRFVRRCVGRCVSRFSGGCVGGCVGRYLREHVSHLKVVHRPGCGQSPLNMALPCFDFTAHQPSCGYDHLDHHHHQQARPCQHLAAAIPALLKPGNIIAALEHIYASLSHGFGHRADLHCTIARPGKDTAFCSLLPQLLSAPL